MKIDYSNFNNYSYEEKKDIIKKELDKIYSDYDFILEKNKLDKYVICGTINQLSSKKSKITQACINGVIKNFILDYIKIELSDESKTKKVIERYINYNFKYSKSYEENIKQISKLMKILDSISFNIDLNIISDLLAENNDFNNMIESIYNHDKNRISCEPISSVYRDFLLQVMTTYCTKNNIPIIEDNLYDIDENSIIYEDDGKEIYDALTQYIHDINKIPLLTQEETEELCYKVLDGDNDAVNKLAEANLGLVVSVAKRYVSPVHRFELLDLIQEGNLGLIKGLSKYDIRKGFKISTYVVWWVRQTIGGAIYDKGKTIRIPAHTYKASIKYNSAKIKLEESLGRKVTPIEMAYYLNISIDKANRIEQLISEPTSLNKKVMENDDSDTELENFIKDTKKTPEEEVVDQTIKEKINIILDRVLNTKEKDIIIKTFDLDGNGRYTYEQISSIYGVTKQRIGQIEQEALFKLRTCKDSNILYMFLNNEELKTDYIKNNYKTYRQYKQKTRNKI